MKKVYKITFWFGVAFFVLGLFDLTETKFGYSSSTCLFGLIVIMYAVLSIKINDLKEVLK